MKSLEFSPEIVKVVLANVLAISMNSQMNAIQEPEDKEIISNIKTSHRHGQIRMRNEERHFNLSFCTKISIWNNSS